MTDLASRVQAICPRCLGENDHSPDDKACSDNCITRHQATIATLRDALAQQEQENATRTWQPMATAPKNELVWLFCEEHGCYVGKSDDEFAEMWWPLPNPPEKTR